MGFSKEEEYLRQKDKKLKKIIDENGHLAFKSNKQNQFDTLVGIVVSQFISTKAANSIFRNIKEKFNSKYLNEKHFKKLTENEIMKLGLSANKARTIKELSEFFLTHKIVDLSELNDQKLNDNLLSIFGIGPWSVNMFEIFCLGRKDIFSSKDAGLRLGMNKALMVVPKSSWDLYDEYAKKWSPYRSIASIHIWHTVD